MANISEITKNKNAAIIGIVALLAIALLVVFVFSGRSSNKQVDESGNSVVNIKNNSTDINIDTSNKLSLRTSSGLFTDKWSKEKVSALIDYFLENGELVAIPGGYAITITIDGETVVLYINGDDELIGSIIDGSTDDSGDSGGSDGGDDIGDIFNDETPTPTPTSVPTPTPTEAGGPGEDYGHPECAYWRLSYCADPLPTPTPTPDQPVEDGVFLESYCDAWNELGIKSTIISNTVCIE